VVKDSNIHIFNRHLEVFLFSYLGKTPRELRETFGIRPFTEAESVEMKKKFSDLTAD
jgi:hypothetical protein